MPKKVLSVADALQKDAEKRPNRAPSVRLRVLPNQKGYYGYPVPGIIGEGIEFNHRIADLQIFKKGMLNYGGKPVQTITVGAIVYALPAWCEDAKEPSSMVPKEDVDETFALADAESSEM